MLLALPRVWQTAQRGLLIQTGDSPYYHVVGMRKAEIARRLARQSGVSHAEAADSWIASSTRSSRNCAKGKPAPFPGLGRFSPDPTDPISSSRRSRVAMAENSCESSAQSARLVRQCLAEGASVEIDGLGTFLPDAQRGFRFQPRNRPKVFVAYVQEDAAAAERLFRESGSSRLRSLAGPPQATARPELAALHRRGHRYLGFLPGLLFAPVGQEKGRFPGGNPLRAGLHAARSPGRDFPDSGAPGRLPVPPRIQRETQYIDLFPDWDRGFRRIVAAMRRQWSRRRPLERRIADGNPHVPLIRPT